MPDAGTASKLPPQLPARARQPLWKSSSTLLSRSGCFTVWTPAGPNLLVSIELKPYSFESAYSLIDTFDDPLPEDLLHRLLANIHYRDEDIKEDLATRRSYSSAARVLRCLMQRRKEEYRRLEEARRARLNGKR